MPSWAAPGAGGNPTDVATTFVANLAPYGMTIPMYFCPVRDQDFAEANNEFKNGTSAGMGLSAQHRNLNNVTDLALWFSTAKSVNGNYSKLLHDWWVPRTSILSGELLISWPGVTQRCELKCKYVWLASQIDRSGSACFTHYQRSRGSQSQFEKHQQHQSRTDRHQSELCLGKCAFLQ